MKYPMRAVVLATVLFGVGCALDAPAADPPVANRTMFDNQVYSLLLADCGFPECHGALSMEEARFFRVYGPGRSRYLESTEVLDPVTETEMDFTYARARSMLAGASSAEETLLVRKPLAVDAGGAPHMGRTAFGSDVYSDTDAGGYELLLMWAETATYPGGE